MMVIPYYSPDGSQVAVLVAPGFGAGWSTWGVPELAYDHRIVEWWMEHNDADYCRKIEESGMFSRPESPEHREFANKLREWGYGDHVYMGGYADIELVWVDCGRQWQIEEYDGNEYIVFADQQQWHSF